MKRILSLCLLLIALLTVASCGQKTVESTTKDNKSHSNGSDGGRELIEKKISGVTFQIPDTWREEIESPVRSSYHNTDGMLSVQFITGVHLNVGSPQAIGEWLDTFGTDLTGYEVLQQSSDTIANIPVARCQVRAVINENLHNIDIVLLNTADGLAVFALYIKRDSNVNYTTDFDSILNSITIENAYIADAPPREDKTASKNDDSISSTSTRYKEGHYKVGVDIPPGEYILFSEEDYSYFSISSDSTGSPASVVAHDNFSYNSIVTISDGQYLEIAQAYAIPLEANPHVNTGMPGMFKVGLHIPAGEYKLTSDEGGYYQVTSDSSHLISSIISINNFEGQRYITVSDGQYLILSKATIIQ